MRDQGKQCGRRGPSLRPPRNTECYSTPSLLRLGKQRVIMASFNHERVGHALDELLQRIVPDDPNDTEEAAEQRLQEAYDFSMQQLIAAGESKAVPDVTHIASLLEAKSEKCIGRLSM